MNATEIVMSAGMSARPGYYSGRGATISDLDGNLLSKIRTTIQKEKGKDAAQGFTEMIRNASVLSATAFLQSLYKLESNDWKFNGTSDDQIYPDSKGSAWGTIISVSGGSLNKRKDQTDYIKWDFLQEGEIPQM